ncbi:hypothetical protein VU07_02010, partial [Desulfobulbus sp. F4]|nr:hypothetical protein [Desulfobulbus sp. F4]
QIIVRRNLFKTAAEAAANAETKPQPSQPPPVVPTALNLTLAGTVTGTEQTARAILVNNAGKDRKQQLLQIGDGVPGTGAVIKIIDWNSITLDVNGKLEVLEMPKPKNALPGFSTSARPSMPAPNQSANPIPEEPVAEGEPQARPNRRINPPPDLSQIEAPQIEMPDIETPPIQLPDIELPDIELPELKDAAMPPHANMPAPAELPPVDAH